MARLLIISSFEYEGGNMLIPRDIASLTKMLSAKAEQVSGSAPSQAQSGDNFQNILENVITSSQKNAVPSSGFPAMSQDQMMLLVRALQIQMNSRLYNTIFSNGLESNLLAAQVVQKYGGNIAQYVSDASNNVQESPKKKLPDAGLGIDRIIQEAANTFNVDAGLIRSVIKAESNFNSEAKSPKGAMGLMQLMPETARELGVKNSYDARENVMGGTRYLKMLLNRYNGQVDLALAAYNWGMGNLERNPHQLPRETLNYVAKVNSFYKNPQA